MAAESSSGCLCPPWLFSVGFRPEFDMASDFLQGNELFRAGDPLSALGRYSMVRSPPHYKPLRNALRNGGNAPLPLS